MCIKTLYEKWNQKKRDWDRIQCLLRKLALAHKQLRMYKEFWDNVSEAMLLVKATKILLKNSNIEDVMARFTWQEDKVKNNFPIFKIIMNKN